MNEVVITSKNFEEEVLKSDKPVIVDFWASWCGPCRTLSPTLEEIAKEHPEIKICKCNVDEENELAKQYNVMSIPFLAAFKNGKLVNYSIGVQSKEKILSLLE